MPKPKKDEKKQDFIARCIPIVVGEGETRDKAIAKCHGIWESDKKKSESTEEMSDVMKFAGGNAMEFKKE